MEQLTFDLDSATLPKDAPTSHDKIHTRGFYPVDVSKLKDLDESGNPKFPKFDAEKVKMPRRSTKFAAGYDIYNNTGDDIVLQPNQTSDAIPTGIVAYMRNNEFFSVFVRSGHGFKHSLRLANSTGIIDADFLKEIMIKIRNPYNKIITIPAGDAMAQGIFMQYLTSDDDGATAGGDRVGGFGSTDKK